jgi:hypothetical protein
MFWFTKKEVTNHGRFCKECGNKKRIPESVGGRFCLYCRKNTLSNIHISLSETIKVRDSFRLDKKSASFRRFAVRVLGGWYSSKRYKEGVILSRTLDKEKDEYHEVVKEYETGKVVHESHEKLTEHTNHGSAKGRENGEEKEKI